LASLQTFYNFASLAENPRVAGVKYKTIIRELEQVLTQPIEQLPDQPDFFNDFRKRLDDLELEAPVVPQGIYDSVEDGYASVIFAETAASLAGK